MVCAYNRAYYSAILPFATTWMNLEGRRVKHQKGPLGEGERLEVQKENGTDVLRINKTLN